MDVPEAGGRLLDEFFRPLDALGSSPKLVARWLKLGGIGRRDQVLDLGCGKGATSIEIARVTGCAVLGIDAFEAFVLSCRGLAAVRGVGDRCAFRVGLAENHPGRDYDGVVLLNVLPFERAIPLARRMTRPGGCYLIDDAVASVRGPGFPKARDVLEAIESAGDRVERAKVWRESEVRTRGGILYKLLRKNAAALARKNPADRALLAECLRRMRAGVAELSGEFRPACWLVRRGRR